MFEAVSTRTHTLDIGGEAAPGAPLYTGTSGWTLVSSVERWLAKLQQFQALTEAAMHALESGTMADRDAVAAQITAVIAMIENAHPTPTLDMDVRTAIGVASKEVLNAKDPALQLRLVQLDGEAAAFQKWLTARLGATGDEPTLGRPPVVAVAK